MWSSCPAPAQTQIVLAHSARVPKVARTEEDLKRTRDKLAAQRDEIETLDTQLVEERALKEALVKRLEVVAATKASTARMTSSSRVTMVDPSLAVSLKRPSARASSTAQRAARTLAAK